MTEEKRALSARLQAPQTQAALFDPTIGLNPHELKLMSPESTLAASLAAGLIKQLNTKMKDEIRGEGLNKQSALNALHLAFNKVPNAAQYQHPAARRLIYQNVVEQLRHPVKAQPVAAVKL